jgi:hypothetical protein
MIIDRKIAYFGLLLHQQTPICRVQNTDIDDPATPSSMEIQVGKASGISSM